MDSCSVRRNDHKGHRARAAAGERQGSLQDHRCVKRNTSGYAAEVRKLRIRVLDTGGGLKVSWERSSGEGGPTPQASSEESLDSGRSPEVKRGGGTLPTSPSEGWTSWYKLVKESTGRTAVPDIILAVARRYRIRTKLTTGNWVKIPVR